MPDPYQSDMPPFNGTNPLQSLSAGELTAEHVGQMAQVRKYPPQVLKDLKHSRHGYVTLWLASATSLVQVTLSEGTLVTLGPQQEVTGD